MFWFMVADEETKFSMLYSPGLVLHNLSVGAEVGLCSDVRALVRHKESANAIVRILDALVPVRTTKSNHELPRNKIK